MKPNRNSFVYKTTQDLLVNNGFAMLREFQPKQSDAIGNELFQLWTKKGNNIMVQFYANESGVEFYPISKCDNTWKSAEEMLANF